MAYIGRQNLGGAYRQLDDISSGFDGSDTTHTMQVNSQNVTVGDVNQIILSLGGVIQKPGTDFTVSGSVLTFTTAPAANTSFFAILLGSDNGGTVTPTDGSVTGDKLASNIAITTSGDVSLDGGSFVFNESSADKDFRIETNGNSSMFFVDGGNDAVIFNGSTSNFASGSQAVQVYNSGLSFTSGYGIQGGANTDRASLNLTSGASGHIVFKANNTEVARMTADGYMTKPLQPAFIASVSSTQSNLSNSDTITMPEITSPIATDRNSDFASSTFTAPVTGLYQFNFSVSVTQKDETATYDRVTLVTSNRVYKFGITPAQMFDSAPSYHVYAGSTLADMDAGDTAKLRWDQSGGSAQADVFDSSYFSGFLVM